MDPSKKKSILRGITQMIDVIFDDKTESEDDSTSSSSSDETNNDNFCSHRVKKKTIPLNVCSCFFLE